MAISRKPQTADAPIDVDGVTSRVGSRADAGKRPTESAVVPVVLRIPRDMLQQVEAALKERPFKTPRHTWILEAIHEKLNRDIVR